MRLLYKTGPMESLRKWFYKPKRDDRSLLAQFFFADDALNMVATELDSFDGRKDPERCSTLVNQLRHAQDRVLNITSQIMDQVLGEERVARGFRVKFPEDVLQDNLAGQLWFGAECLAAGSSIMNREEESAAMRPLAKALTRSLETVRALLREHCLRARGDPLRHADDMLYESLRIFDRLFAEFELCYVSAMVSVKTPHEFEAQQLICVLFSESLRRALRQGLLTQEQVDSYDPALMFAVPRLAIVSGLLIYSSGPLSIDKPPEMSDMFQPFRTLLHEIRSLVWLMPYLSLKPQDTLAANWGLASLEEMSDMFRPFRTLLHKIRSLVWTLSRRELRALERLLCDSEDASAMPPALKDMQDGQDSNDGYEYPDIDEFVTRFYADHEHCRDLYSQSSSNEPVITEHDYLPDNIEVMTPIIDGLRRLSEDTETEQESDTESRPERPEPSRQYSETSVDTFHSDTRKTSRQESNDLSSLRNLSTNGLNMFDPLLINAASDSRQIPDNDLVTSLNEQVKEIADKLSSIATTDIETLEHSQMHSFSTNDMPSIVSDEAFGFAGPRNEQLSCMPSTSHGYLIPNAISQEPVVMSLSHNNSAVFNPEEDASGAIISNDFPLIPENLGADIVNTNISIANANLSSLLLSNEELRDEDNEEDESFHSAKTSIERSEEERVRFMLGCESEQESPADSGVSTENASLDRSPDTEPVDSQYLQQNRVLPTDDAKDNALESSFSVNNDIVNINYVEAESAKSEAGASVDNNNVNNISRISTEEYSEATNSRLHDWGANDPVGECRSIDDVLNVLRSQRKSNKKINALVEEDNNSNPEPTSSRRRSAKQGGKKRKKKMWAPGIVILNNRTANGQTPLKLNLDQFVDDSYSSSFQCAGDEQLALALQARELAARRAARGKFKSSEDLIHRLFVCIAGVADQLQTNFAADLRNILKSVFVMNQSPEPETPPPGPEDKPLEYEVTEDQVIQNGSSFDSVYSAEEVYADSTSDSTASETNSRLVRRNTVNASMEQPAVETRRKSSDANGNLQASVSTGDLTYSRERARTAGGSPPAGGESPGGSAVERAPEWVPDIAAPACMRCRAHFTAFRRRHHCRNCGKVFCASCSSNSVPLPRFGQMKPVRVCEECFRGLADACRRTR